MKIKTNKYQSGVVLAISLIMLLLLTLIGITGSQVTSLEEKMAGNEKDYNLAFQAAETTLREAEKYIEGLTTMGDFDGTNPGLLQEADFDAGDYYLTLNNWSSSNSVASSKNFSLIPSSFQPRYIIKYMFVKKVDKNAKLNIGGYGESTAGGQVTIFKVTSRSTGVTGLSQVVLQSFYGKKL